MGLEAYERALREREDSLKRSEERARPILDRYLPPVQQPTSTETDQERSSRISTQAMDVMRDHEIPLVLASFNRKFWKNLGQINPLRDRFRNPHGYSLRYSYIASEEYGNWEQDELFGDTAHPRSRAVWKGTGEYIDLPHRTGLFVEYGAEGNHGALPFLHIYSLVRSEGATDNVKIKDGYSGYIRVQAKAGGYERNQIASTHIMLQEGVNVPEELVKALMNDCSERTYKGLMPPQLHR